VKQPHNRSARQRRSLKHARQLRNVKRRHNVRQLHNRSNGKRRHNAKRLRSRNSTLRLRKTKTNTLISCVPQGIRGNIRGCRLNPRALATLPATSRGKSAPTPPATNCAKPCLLIQGR